MSDSTTDPGTNDNNNEEMPGWARDQLNQVRNEAASKRVELRDTKQSLEEATTKAAELQNTINSLTDEVSGLKNNSETAQIELMKLNAVLKAGVPGDRAADYAARLQGTTEEELNEDATKVAELFTTPNPGSAPGYDPSQGRGSDRPVSSTPSESFAEVLRGQLGNLRQ